jgi:cytochrome c oxidase subunit II
MRFGRWLRAALATGVIGLLAMPPSFAQNATGGGVVGAPKPWEMGMQQAYGPLKEREVALHNLVLVIITLITLLVAGLLVWVMVRHNAKRNPVPSQTTHNTVIEVIWTLAPVLVLLIIAIPSFRLVYYEDKAEHPDMTIKVTGHQWYWEYSYPDQGNIDVESRFVADEDLKPGDLRLLTVDKQMVIPVGKRIRVLTTSSDVIHSFFVPAMGVQRYAIPGRTIETWFEASQPGTFYGECNQICGENHSRMPISIKAVSQQEFDAWVANEKKSASGANAARIVAENATADAKLRN